MEDKAVRIIPPKVNLFDLVKEIEQTYKDAYHQLTLANEVTKPAVRHYLSDLAAHHFIIKLLIEILNFLILQKALITDDTDFENFNKMTTDGIKAVVSQHVAKYTPNDEFEIIPVQEGVLTLFDQETNVSFNIHEQYIQAISNENMANIHHSDDINNDILKLQNDIATLVSQYRVITEKRATATVDLEILKFQTENILPHLETLKIKELAKIAPDLHLAAITGDYQPAVQLLNSGSDAKRLLLAVQDESPHKATPLHYACFALHPKLISLFLESGAAVNVRDGFGFTPLHWMMRIVTNPYTDGELLSRFHQCLEIILNANPDLTAVDRNGRTMLHTAAKYGNYHGIIWCRKLGMNVNLIEINEPYLTPLTSAVKQGHEHVIPLLISMGASNCTHHPDTHTPLYHAIFEGHIKIAILLQDHGFTLTRWEREEFSRIINRKQSGNKSRGDQYCGNLISIFQTLSETMLQQLSLHSENLQYGPGYESNNNRKTFKINDYQLEFQEFCKVRNDACWHLLKTNKRQFCHNMLLSVNNEDVRAYLAYEIAEALLLKPYNYPKSNRNKVVSISERFISLHEQWVTRFKKIYDLPIQDKTVFANLETLMCWLKINDQSTFVEISSMEQQLKQCRREMFELAKSIEAYVTYFTKMIDDKFSLIDPGIYSLLFWCRQKGINVTVWHPSLHPQINSVYIDESLSIGEADAKDGLHIMVNDHCHDFSVLHTSFPLIYSLQKIRNLVDQPSAHHYDEEDTFRLTM